MKLVIAEKPSVAMSIAKLIGAKNKKDGCYEGNDYRVSWCVGHLVQMANPD
ncbi:MAG: toprim domain-containing protein, partial [Peptoniphilus lacydonensis]|nr:toprim domain-containing protein [Peptoniphilus lacydonensis]